MRGYIVMERIKLTVARPNRPASYSQLEVSRHDTLADAKSRITTDNQWVECPDGRHWIGGVFLDDPTR